MSSEIHQILEQHNESVAVFELECQVADRKGELPEGWADALPAWVLGRSPILMRAYAWELAEQGRLGEAKSIFEQVLKDFARQTALPELLTAMSQYAQINLRLGAAAEAETALRFLAEERTRNPDVLFALGRGGFIPGLSFEERIRNYEQAANLYIEQDRVRRSLEAVLEWTRLSWAAAAERSSGESPFTAIVSQRARWDARYKAHVALLQLLNYVTSQDEESQNDERRAGIAKEQWEQLSSSLADAPLGQYYKLLLKILATRAGQLLGMGNHGEICRISGEIAEQFSADLELRAEFCLLSFEVMLSSGEFAGAEQALRECEALASIGLPAEFTGQIHSNRERLSRSKAVSALTERKLATEPEQAWRAVCFDGFRLERSGGEVQTLRWKRKKAQELFYYLLLRPGHSVAKEQAIDVLFGDAAPDKASNQLYVAIHEVKRVLHTQMGWNEAPFIRDGVVQLPEKYIEEVDVEKYNALIRVADQLHHSDPFLSIEFYENAAEMYQPMLPNVQFIDWLDRIRDELEQKQIHALRQLYKLVLRKGETERAELFCRQWCEIGPLDEEAYQALLRLLVDTGREAEAKRIYHQFEKTLFRELKTTPFAETKRIVYPQ